MIFIKWVDKKLYWIFQWGGRNRPAIFKDLKTGKILEMSGMYYSPVYLFWRSVYTYYCRGDVRPENLRNPNPFNIWWTKRRRRINNLKRRKELEDLGITITPQDFSKW